MPGSNRFVWMAFAVSSLYLAAIGSRIHASGWQDLFDGPAAPVRNARQLGTALTSLLVLGLWAWCAAKLLRRFRERGRE